MSVDVQTQVRVSTLVSSVLVRQGFSLMLGCILQLIQHDAYYYSTILLTFSFILLLVYQRKFAHEKNYAIQCYLGRTIKIIWVNYDSTKTTCVSTKATQLMQGKCDGKATCTFYIRKVDFLGSSSCSGDSNTFLLRYTCKVDARPGKLKVRLVGRRLVRRSVSPY